VDLAPGGIGGARGCRRTCDESVPNSSATKACEAAMIRAGIAGLVLPESTMIGSVDQRRSL
jgi:hypothetical protein